MLDSEFIEACLLKALRLPANYLVTVLTAVFFLEVLPYLEEFWRGLRADKSHLTTALRPRPG
jgi:hypothetical protein